MNGKTIKTITSLAFYVAVLAPLNTFAATGGPIASSSTLAEFNSYVILASVLIGAGLLRKTREID